MSPKLNHPKTDQQAREPHPPVIRKRTPVPKPSTGGDRVILAESILTSKGQVTIPQAIRSLYQLDIGDSLVWRQEADGRLMVEPKRSLTLADIRAAVSAAGAPTPARVFTNAEMDDAIGQALEAKFGRH
jgi:bifunctional DNA-binding transcriptional regulator/antitoxin component of YhaV-PrlF toxin-antitoxin module